jgi:membrane-associated HD superfamily phosphohydrolase
MNRWRELYIAAVLVSDPKKREEYVQAAEEAIEQRLKSLSSQIPNQEKQDMQDALRSLRVLRRECADSSSESSKSSSA